MIMNEAPWSKLQVIKRNCAEANPPSLYELRRGRLAINPSSKLQGILAKANKVLVVLFVSLALCSCGGSKRRLPSATYTKPAIVLPETSKPYSVDGVTYYPLPSGEGFVQEGVASWYGRKFHGRKTSSGEVYNMYDNTAAHKTLPFGTRVSVKNLSNSKVVVVRINDRGPFV